MDTLKVKRADNGSWVDWSGQDGWCVEYGDNARGKWKNSDTEIAAGFNVSISGSLTTCPGL